DRIAIPPKPLDVLAQQVVAEVAAREWSEEDLFGVFTRAYPYATLTREEYLSVVRMVAEGFSTRRGHRAAYVHRDAVNGVLRGRRLPGAGIEARGVARGTARRVSRRGACRARHAADAEDDRVRALLRRIGRDAVRTAQPVRQPHQPRLGPGTAQALLPQVQFRAAGGG